MFTLAVRERVDKKQIVMWLEHSVTFAGFPERQLLMGDGKTVKSPLNP